MSSRGFRSYQGAPRVYLIHADGEFERLWYCATPLDGGGRWFPTWREAINYALSIKPPMWATWRRHDPRRHGGHR